MIDAATRANLELMRTLSGERRGALIAAIDRTVTPAGARLLGARLAAPLTDPARSRGVSMRSRCLSRTARRARMCARSLAPRRTSRVRSRASCCSAADRAIWRHP